MNKTYIAITTIAILVLALILFIFELSRKADHYAVTKQKVVKSVYASGYVDCENRVIIKSEVSGYIEELYVQEGDKVERGQALAKITNETTAQQLKEVRTRKRFVENRLKEDSDYIKSLKSGIEINKLNVENAKKVFERRKTLHKKGLIAKESYDDAERAYLIAKKRHEQSVESFRDAVNSLKTELESLKANEAALQNELDKYTIISPITGEVLRKFANTGDYININISAVNRIYSVGNTNETETVLTVDEEFIPLLRKGQKVLINSDAYPDRVFEGKLTLVERESDIATRTVEVKADIDYDEDIPICSTVEANIVVEERDALFIPRAVIRNGVVRVVVEGKLVDKSIKTGIEKDDFIEVVEGLDEGQEVYTK